MKRCKKCGEEKPLHEFWTYKTRRGEERPMARCRTCKQADHDRWLADNKPQFAETQRRKRANPTYRALDAQRHAEARAAMSEEEKAEWLEVMRARNAEVRSRMTREQKQSWRDAVNRWKARKRYGTKIIVKVDRIAIMERDGYSCYLWCERKNRLDESQVELDHVVPLAREGSHTPENLRVACKPCNKRKGQRLLSEIANLPQTAINP